MKQIRKFPKRWGHNEVTYTVDTIKFVVVDIISVQCHWWRQCETSGGRKSHTSTAPQFPSEPSRTFTVSNKLCGSYARHGNAVLGLINFVQANCNISYGVQYFKEGHVKSVAECRLLGLLFHPETEAVCSSETSAPHTST